MWLDEVIFIFRAVFGDNGEMLGLTHSIDSNIGYSDRIAFTAFARLSL